LVYDEVGRGIETIIERNMPEEFSATYEAKGVRNWLDNRLYEEGPDETRWVMVIEFEFSSFMRLAGVFMHSVFPKQTLETMNRFGGSAETAG
jgi:hypothetical protein